MKWPAQPLDLNTPEHRVKKLSLYIDHLYTICIKFVQQGCFTSTRLFWRDENTVSTSSDTISSSCRFLLLSGSVVCKSLSAYSKPRGKQLNQQEHFSHQINRLLWKDCVYMNFTRTHATFTSTWEIQACEFENSHFLDLHIL